MPSDSDMETLISKIDTLIAVTAAQVGVDLPLSQRAPLLNALGLDRRQIARACNTSPAIISVRLAEAKRDRKRGGRKAARKKAPRRE